MPVPFSAGEPKATFPFGPSPEARWGRRRTAIPEIASPEAPQKAFIPYGMLHELLLAAARW